MVETGPGLSNGCGIGEHAHTTLYLGQVTTRHDGWGLVVDTHFEPSWAPVHELDGALGLYVADGCVYIFWHYIPSVEETASHVLAMARIALHHLIQGLKAGSGDVSHSHLFVIGFLSRDDGGIGHKGEVDARVGYQVGLKLCEVHVKSTIKAQRGSDGRHNLSNQTVEVGVAWALYIQVPAADVVDSFVVHHECAVGVFQGGVCGQDRVVWLHDGRGNLRRGVDGELEFRLLAVIDGEALHQERRETGAGATAKRAEDHKPLEAGALVGKFAHAVHHLVNQFFPHRVVSAGIVVGGVFHTRDELLWMKQLAVGSRAHFVHNRRLEIDKYATWYVLARAGFAKERGEGVVAATQSRVRRHQSVRLDAVLEAVQLPAGVAHLAACLPDVDRNHLTHFCFSS